MKRQLRQQVMLRQRDMNIIKVKIVIHMETGQHGQNGVSIPWLRVMYVMLKRIRQQERYCTVIRREKRQRLQHIILENRYMASGQVGVNLNIIQVIQDR